MVARRPAIRRMFTHVLRAMDHREPSIRDWAVGERMSNVLEHPCKIVLKSQDKGHWLLPHAVDRMCRLYVETQTWLREQHATEKPADPLTIGLQLMETTMRESLIAHLKKFVAPVQKYVRERAHVAMALLCDHRHRRGEIFFWMSDASLSREDRKQVHGYLVQQYTNNHLIPAMVALKMGQAGPSTIPNQGGQGQRQRPHPPEFDVPEDLFDLDTQVGSQDQQAVRSWMQADVQAELDRFRAKDAVTDAEMDQHPLDWWRAHEPQYPMLAHAARIFLSCPGSQIECERVFSLCGLTVSLLRNRMTTDNLSDVVYITKNSCQVSELEDILGAAHGKQPARSYLSRVDGEGKPNIPRDEATTAEVAIADDEGADVEPEVDYDCGEENTLVLDTPFDWEEVVNLNELDDDSQHASESREDPD